MPDKSHTSEFESCIEQVMKQGHDKGSAFAICTDVFKKAGKPIFVGEAETQKLHLFCESFKLKGNKVSGVAIHPKRIFHPEEGMMHVYLREELEKAAPTLVGKPFGIDHMYILPPPNLVTEAWYDRNQNGVAFQGLVDDHIADQIRKKVFKGLSIELNWLRPSGKVEFVNGVAARNFEFTSVHLLKRFPPGDKDAYIKLWEQLVVGPPLPIDQRVEALEAQIQEILNQISVINGKLEVLTGQPSPSATGISAQPGPSQTIGEMKMKEQNTQEPEAPAPEEVPTPPQEPTLEEVVKSLQQAVEQINENFAALDARLKALEGGGTMAEAEWDTEYINNLPDDAFAYIEPGGEKDEQGKTVPRSLRHLPYKNAQGNLDADHVRNALARLDQTDIPPEGKAEAKKKLCAAAKELNIASEVCGLAESADIVSLRKQLVDFEAKLAEYEKRKKQQADSLKKKYRDFRESIRSTIPPSHIWKAWTPGPQMMVQQQLKVFRETES